MRVIDAWFLPLPLASFVAAVVESPLTSRSATLEWGSREVPLRGTALSSLNFFSSRLRF